MESLSFAIGAVVDTVRGTLLPVSSIVQGVNICMGVRFSNMWTPYVGVDQLESPSAPWAIRSWVCTLLGF